MLITERGVGKAAHVTAEAVDERGNPTAGISVKVEFPKFVSTYTGSNWISESSPFYPSKPPAGSRSFSAEISWLGQKRYCYNHSGLLSQCLKRLFQGIMWERLR